MKKIKIFTLAAFILLILGIVSCGKQNETQTLYSTSGIQQQVSGPTCTSCDTPLRFTEDFNFISGTVRKADNDDDDDYDDDDDDDDKDKDKNYTFGGSLYYIEADAKYFLKNTYIIEKKNTIRIYVCESSINLANYKNKKITISGKLYICSSKNNGNSNNSSHDFNVAIPLKIQ